MKILMITHYPPQRCGIGAYAEQSVARLRQEGNIVNILTPAEGDGDFVEDLTGGFKLLRLLKYRHYYDRVIMQYCPSYYFMPYDRPGSWRENIKACLAFAMLPYWMEKLEVICHEELYYKPEDIGRIPALFHRLKWLSHKQVCFHTQREREQFVQHVRPINPKGRCILRDHGRDFIKYADLTREEARRRLGIEQNQQVFLCIGFIQPHKGFDRAMSAFLQTTQPNASLYVVGSLRLDYDLTRNYLNRLRELEESASGRVHLVEKYVDNEELDTWISASDYVVVPYEEAWSSSILERAKLFGKPVVASSAGGLGDQVGPDDRTFKTEEQLVNVFFELTDSTLKIHNRNGNMVLKKGATELELNLQDFRQLLETLRKILAD